MTINWLSSFSVHCDDCRRGHHRFSSIRRSTIVLVVNSTLDILVKFGFVVGGRLFLDSAVFVGTSSGCSCSSSICR